MSVRFNREHQMLARMEHPNIAAMFDAGELPDGRTYFVMEWVHGAPVTTWCREHQTPVPERLEIFLLTCMADKRGRLRHEHDAYPQADYLRAARQAAASIAAQPFVERGLQGPAIGEAMRRAQVAAIASIAKPE